MKRLIDFSSRFRILKGGKISLVVSALLGGVTLSVAAPIGGAVTSGSATITQNGNITNVVQSTQKASINWQSFSIGTNEIVNFNQPNSSAIALNRVIGNERSVIDGALNANGQVWILNSNGVLFGKNASINTAGLLATTAQISDIDFQNGNYNFKDATANSVINEGTITISDGGLVILASNEVQNAGTIEAIKGKINIVGADSYTLNLNGNSLLSLKVDKGVLDALVENSGHIIADGGEIYLSTNAINELLKGVVNNTGIIEANSVDGITGYVELTGEEINLKSGSQIYAKGTNGGGKILVGGDWQGSGDLKQATTVTMENGAKIDASATKNGDGGTVVLWSDVNNPNSYTQMDGEILATGAGSGMGGKVETSGHVLGVTGVVNAGVGGEWLLDPVNITIANSGGQVTPDNIVNALNVGTSVTIDTTGTGSCTGVNCTTTGTAGDIAVNNSIITGAMANDATLTLKAYRNITMAGSTTIDATQNSNTHKLNVVFQANASDANGTGAGTITLGTEATPSASIKTNGGDIILGGGSDIATGYAIGYAAGVATENGIRMYRPTLLSDGGNIVIRGKSKPGADGTNGVLIEGRGGAWTIDSGTGTVAITGVSTGTGTNFASGVRFNYQAGTLKSAAESADAIRIFGDASATSGNGTRSDGVTLENATTIAATGAGGGIRIEGIGTSNSCTASGGACYGISALGAGGAKFLANGGPINLTASGGSGVNTKLYLTTSTVGYAAGTDVTASISNITLTADTVNLTGSTIQSSGTLTVQPYTVSTNIGVGAGTGTLLLPATYWSGASSIFKDGFSSITIGRANGSGVIDANNSTFNDPVTLQTNGNINLASIVRGLDGLLEVKAGGDITLKGGGFTAAGASNAHLSLSGARILTEASTTNNLSGPFVTLTADQLDLNTSTKVDGDITLHVQPLNPSRPIDIGTFATNASHLQLSQAYFSRHGTIGIFDDGFSQIVVGRSDGGGNISLNDLSFGDSLTIQSPADAAKATLSGTITTSQNTYFGGSLTVKVGGDIEVSAGSHITTHNTEISDAEHGSVVLHAGASNGNGSIQVLSGAIINAAGNLTLGGGSDLATGYATGSATTGTRDRGIYLDNAQLTAGIDLTLRGQGWQGGSAAENPVGVDLRNDSILKAEGDGKITIDGLGGNGSGISNGINIQGSTISSYNGAMSLTGLAGTSGSRRAGIGVDTGNSYIYARGFPAPISLTGTGSNATDSEGISSSGTGGTLKVGADSLGTLNVGSTGQMTLTADTMNLAGMTFYPKTPTRLRVQPLTASTTIGIAGGAGTLQLPASYFVDNFLAGFDYLTIGNENAGDITVGDATSISDDTRLTSGGNIRIDGNLSVATPDTSRTLVLSGGSGSTVSGNGNILVTKLILDGSRGAAYQLHTATNNKVQMLAASAGSAGVRFYNNRALEVTYVFDDSPEDGSGSTIDGITSSGKIDIATLEGALEIRRNITTTDASADAIVLNAGRSRAAGDPAGGDISWHPATSISTGSGGRALLYTGRVSGTTGVSSRVSSGNFRYNSDEVTTNYTQVLGDTGIYAIYREGAQVSVNFAPVSKIYDGQAYSGSLNAVWFTGLKNGDTDPMLTGTPVLGTEKNVGTYSITPSGLSSALGYVIAPEPVSLSINRLDSVTWTGGTSGNWFDPANWEGGAVPDLSNVANVIIPEGVTVNFDENGIVGNAQSGMVVLDSLKELGSLNMVNGELNVAGGGIKLNTLNQSGGEITSEGDIVVDNFIQSGGTTSTESDFTTNENYEQSNSGVVNTIGNTLITDNEDGVVLGNIASGNLEVESTDGDIAQEEETTILVAEETTLEAEGDIVLDGEGNDFQGPVNAKGDDIALVDGTDGIILGDIESSGNLEVESTDGDITQKEGTTIKASHTPILNVAEGFNIDVEISLKENETVKDSNKMDEETTINNIAQTVITPIINSVVLPQISLQNSPQKSNNLGVQKPVIIGTGVKAPVISQPLSTEATQVVTSDELSASVGTDIRVPLRGDSIIELVNGGVNLPVGVEQLFFIAVDEKTGDK